MLFGTEMILFVKVATASVTKKIFFVKEASAFVVYKIFSVRKTTFFTKEAGASETEIIGSWTNRLWFGADTIMGIDDHDPFERK